MMIRKGFIFLCLFYVSSAIASPEQVYLLGSFTVNGSPVTTAIILKDKRISDLDKCWDFVHNHVRGKERGRNYFRHYIRQQPRGVNIQPRYYCFTSNVKIPTWNDKDFYNHVYLIDSRNKLMFTRFDSTNSCWGSIRKEPEKHTSKLYCAKMSQDLSEL